MSAIQPLKDDPKDDIIPMRRIPLMCKCESCKLPFGYLALTPQGFVIQIESHHHGEKHISEIPLALTTGDLTI